MIPLPSQTGHGTIFEPWQYVHGVASEPISVLDEVSPEEQHRLTRVFEKWTETVTLRGLKFEDIS